MASKRIIAILTVCLVVVALTIPCFASAIVNEDSAEPFTSTGNFVIGISENQDDAESNIWEWIVADAPCMQNNNSIYESGTKLNQDLSQDLEELNPTIWYPNKDIPSPNVQVVDNIESIYYWQYMLYESNRYDVSRRYMKFALYDFLILPGDMSIHGYRDMTRKIRVIPIMATTGVCVDVQMNVKFEGKSYTYELSESELQFNGAICDSSFINCDRLASELEVEFELPNGYLDDKIILVEDLTFTILFPHLTEDPNNARFNINYYVREFTDLTQVIKEKGNAVIPDYKNPIGYTNWLGTAISGFFNTQILPGFSFGGILLMIISFLCVVWFLKIFAGG